MENVTEVWRMVWLQRAEALREMGRTELCMKDHPQGHKQRWGNESAKGISSSEALGMIMALLWHKAEQGAQKQQRGWTSTEAFFRP